MLQFDEGFLAAARRLTPPEFKRAVEVVLEVREDPAALGKHVEPLRKGFDSRLRSVRVNRDLRIIALHGDTGFVPLFVGHHEAAYRWAETRRTRTDAATGAVTIIHATAAEPSAYAPAAPAAPPGLFDNYEDTYLLSLGVPGELIPALRHVRSEDDVETVLGKHDGHAYAYRLLDLATGSISGPPPASPATLALTPDTVPVSPEPEPEPPLAAPPVPTPPEAERSQPLRLVSVEDDDLRRMLAAPMEAWIAFLHPSQRGVATRSFAGPATIAGGAGTGKTVVAMHRARHLARQGRRVLLTSFTNNARAVLERGVGLICEPDELARITIRTVHAQAREIIPADERVQPPQGSTVRDLIGKFAAAHGLDPGLAAAEWRHVIQALGITRWEEYRDAQRTGRGVRLAVAERERIWDGVIVPLGKELKRRNVLDWADICLWARQLVASGAVASPFDAVIVDEAQDLGPQELRLLAALAGDEADNLTLVGDGGQRIYPNCTRLRDLGIEVRGRTRTLNLNYRTTRQIYGFAEGLLGNAPTDLDGEGTRRGRVVSLLAGPEPELRGFDSNAAQYDFVAAAIKEREAAGVALHEIGVLAPTNGLVQSVGAALNSAGVPALALGRDHRTERHSVALATIHRAKGLEFKVVFVIGASDNVLAHALGGDDADDGDEAALRDQQRSLLYVAATRTRDELFVCWTGAPSRFLPQPAAIA